MALINKIKFIIVCLLISACSSNSDSDLSIDSDNVLSQFLSSKVYQKDAVIACAASSENDSDLVNVYFYPEEGASDFRLYATSEFEVVDNQDFSEYSFIDLETKPLFNGALRFFEAPINADWFTVVYSVGNTINIATPIKNKKATQPSLWTDVVKINQEEKGMPFFSWEVLSEENNAIFFEVVANENLDLISGTYTFESNFQFYKLDNVVLNITQNTPTELVSGNNYIFTVMDVSLDNWVNQVIMAPFTLE